MFTNSEHITRKGTISIFWGSSYLALRLLNYFNGSSTFKIQDPKTVLYITHVELLQKFETVAAQIENNFLTDAGKVR